MFGTFEPWLDRWGLVPDGEPFETFYTKSRLLPVRQGPAFAMLKIATEPDELRGAEIMDWWAGRGAARVLVHDGPALLLERAMGHEVLTDIVRIDDDRATRLLCEGLETLHGLGGPWPGVAVPLETWFAGLEPVAQSHGGLFAKAREVVGELFAAPQAPRLLHGDMHHENLLDFGTQGWLAIDPKGLIGERGFDYANIFCNPDKSEHAPKVATLPGRLARRVTIASEVSGIPGERLLRWVLAYAALSSAWHVQDGDDPGSDFRMAEIAAAALGL